MKTSSLINITMLFTIAITYPLQLAADDLTVTSTGINLGDNHIVQSGAWAEYFFDSTPATDKRLYFRANNTNEGAVVFGATGDTIHLEASGNLVVKKDANILGGLSVSGPIYTSAGCHTNCSADYVFEDDYELQPLEELEKFVKSKRHLPGIPSEKEVRAEGWDVGKMSVKMLEKIEELTLHLIELNKANKELKEDLNLLKAQG